MLRGVERAANLKPVFEKSRFVVQPAAERPGQVFSVFSDISVKIIRPNPHIQVGIPPERIF